MYCSCTCSWNCYKTLTFAHFWQCAQSIAPATQNDIWTSKSGPTLQFFTRLTSTCASATTAYTFWTSDLQKVLRGWCALYILTWKCASRHNGVHFFNISTSKTPPKLRCFVHFDLDMCFAPQLRTLFEHLNFTKCSEVGVLYTFWLGNVLRA